MHAQSDCSLKGKQPPTCIPKGHSTTRRPPFFPLPYFWILPPSVYATANPSVLQPAQKGLGFACLPPRSTTKSSPPSPSLKLGKDPYRSDLNSSYITTSRGGHVLSLAPLPSLIPHLSPSPLVFASAPHPRTSHHQHRLTVHSRCFNTLLLVPTIPPSSPGSTRSI